MSHGEICLGRFFITVLVCFITCFPLAAGSYSLRLKSRATEIKVEVGVTSSVDFYLDDYQSLDRNIRIIGQFKPSGMSEYDKKCQIEHNKTRCQVAFGPCQCVGPSSGAYQYRLSMNFTQQNAGQWIFSIVDHQQTLINIVVTASRQATTSTPAAQPPTPTLYSVVVTHDTTTVGVNPAFDITTQRAIDTLEPDDTDDNNKSLNSSVGSKDPPRKKDPDNTLLIVSWCMVGAGVLTMTIFLISIVKLLRQRGRGINARLLLGSACAKRSDNDMCAVCDVGEDDETRGHPGCRSSDSEHQVSTSLSTNRDGLIYGQLDFSDRVTSNVIIGSVPNTQYAEVNFSASGQPIVN